MELFSHRRSTFSCNRRPDKRAQRVSAGERRNEDHCSSRQAGACPVSHFLPAPLINISWIFLAFRERCDKLSEIDSQASRDGGASKSPGYSQPVSTSPAEDDSPHPGSHSLLPRWRTGCHRPHFPFPSCQRESVTRNGPQWTERAGSRFRKSTATLTNRGLPSTCRPGAIPTRLNSPEQARAGVPWAICARSGSAG